VGKAAKSQEEVDATLTIQCYGGERSCFSRFLRARNLNLDLAAEMLRETIEFRRRYRVNEILRDTHFLGIWKTERRFWPAAVPIITKDGSLVLYFRMAHFLNFYKRGYSEDRCRDIYMCMMERSLRLQHEGRRRRGQGLQDEMPPVYEIYDCQGIGFEHFRCVIGLRMMPRVLSIGQKHYPENLRSAIILNAPRGLDGIWNFLRQVLHERTQAKVHITGADGKDLLPEVLGTSSEEVNRIFDSLVSYSKNGSSGSSGIYTGGDLMDWLEQSDLMK